MSTITEQPTGSIHNVPAPTDEVVAPENTIMLPAETPMIGVEEMTAGLITKIFTGTLGANQRAVNTVFTLPGWTSAYLDVLVLAHDVNSDTYSKYFGASYAWYRQWDTAPRVNVLRTDFNWGQGSLYGVQTVAAGNDIQIVLSQGSFSTVTRYQVIARYMFGYPS